MIDTGTESQSTTKQCPADGAVCRHRCPRRSCALPESVPNKRSIVDNCTDTPLTRNKIRMAQQRNSCTKNQAIVKQHPMICISLRLDTVDSYHVYQSCNLGSTCNHDKLEDQKLQCWRIGCSYSWCTDFCSNEYRKLQKMVNNKQSWPKRSA